MASFLERQTQIFPLEALAVLQRFFGLPETPILFVDNQAVCAGQSYERLWGCFGPGGILPFALGCSQCSSVDRDDNPSDGLSHAGLPDPWTILQPWQVLQYPCLPWHQLAKLAACCPRPTFGSNSLGK